MTWRGPRSGTYRGLSNARHPGRRRSSARRGLQVLAPRFNEVVVVGVGAAFPTIHVEPDRLQALRGRSREAIVVETSPGIQKIGYARARWQVLDSASKTNKFSVVAMNRCETKALIRNSRIDHGRSEEHTSELQSLAYLVCRLLL